MKKKLYLLLLPALFYQGCQCSGNEKSATDYRKIIHIEAGASRTSGVAPLSVHFTAGFSSSTSASRDFHDHDYTWDFGDTASGNWGTSGKPRNTAKGPVAAHVFETPGTYTVNLSEKDGTTVVNSESFTIEVLNPDAVYSGTNTICVCDENTYTSDSTTAFSGCPDDAVKIHTDNLAEVMSYIKTGTRLLLRRGSSWTTGGLSFPSNTGPVTIGAYGTGTGRDASGIFSNAPLINITGGSFCNLTDKQDWRITDLHLVNSARNAGSFGGDYNFQRILFLHLRIDGFADGLGWSHWNNDSGLMTIDQMVITDCNITNAEGNVIYVGGERIALLGNIIQNARTSHVARVWQAYLGVISNNIISGSSIDNSNGRHALKLAGPGYSTLAGANEHGTPEAGTGLLENRTEFAVVSDNVFGSSGPWPVMIAPQDELTDSQIYDIIFERNRIITNYGTKSPRNVIISLHVTARYVTVRNNLFNGTGSENDYTAISIESAGRQPAPEGVAVYNNTIYRYDNTTGNFRTGIFVGGTASHTIVQNNLVSFPNPGSNMPLMLIQNSGTSLTEGNNLLTGTAGFTDPDNADILLADFSLQPGSPAINAGLTVPVYDDLNGRTRAGIYDIGACESD